MLINLYLISGENDMKKGTLSILSAIIGVTLGAGTMRMISCEEMKKANSLSNKHLSLFLMMNQWVKSKQEGKNLEEYFKKHGYHRIAIYGMSYVGETLVNELKNSKIEIVYGIDQNVNTIYADVNIFSIEDEFEEVDAVVVTAITFFKDIEKALSSKINCPILSLEDILYEY